MVLVVAARMFVCAYNGVSMQAAQRYALSAGLGRVCMWSDNCRVMREVEGAVGVLFDHGVLGARTHSAGTSNFTVIV
jgi:hypothetical protein